MARFPNLLLAAALALPAASRADESVRVTNFPRVQRVQVDAFPRVQAVSLEGHQPVTAFKAWPGLRVGPVSPATGADDLERFDELGRLDASGFRSLSLAVAGRLSGSRSDEPAVEVVLLPDTSLVREAWKRDGVLLLEHRVRMLLEPQGKGLFEADASPIPLRFPAYLVFVRNDSSQGIELDLYAQLGE